MMEGDVQGLVADRPAVTDELVEPGVGELPAPVGIGVDTVRAARRRAVQEHLESDRLRAARRQDEGGIAGGK